jgi:hypothetical protein
MKSRSRSDSRCDETCRTFQRGGKTKRKANEDR